MGRLIGAALATLLSTCAASAMQFTIGANGHMVIATGEIRLGDEAWLVQAYNAACERNKFCPDAIALDSVGGSLMAGARMAKNIREAEIDTVVGPDAECSSACVMMFAAGRNKYRYLSSLIGVHNASLNYEDSDGGTMNMIKFLADLGVPATVIGKLAVTSSADIAWISVADWPQVEVLEAGYVKPGNPSDDRLEEPQQEVKAWTMSCTSTETGNTYFVTWTTAGMYANNKWFEVADWHTNAKTGAHVASGPTKYGSYQAVWGGPKPRIVFKSSDGTVTDNCWGVSAQ